MTATDVQEQRGSLAGVPALLASITPPEVAAERGTVLVLHGFTVDKEAQRIEAHSLARAGYLAVTLDAVGHGERRYPDFAQRFPPDDELLGDLSFYAMLAEAAGELPAVVAALREHGWARPGKLGAVGISMGAITLFGAIVGSPRCELDAVVAIIGSPRWRHVATSPHDQLDRYYPTALLMHTGGADTVVPPGDARALHAALVPRYAATPERLRYVEQAGEGHMMSPDAWHTMWADALSWFARFLR